MIYPICYMIKIIKLYKGNFIFIINNRKVNLNGEIIHVIHFIYYYIMVFTLHYI